MANVATASAVIIDFAAAKAHRSAQQVQSVDPRPQRTREELLQIGRDAYNANPKAYHEWAIDQIIQGFGWFD